MEIPQAIRSPLGVPAAIIRSKNELKIKQDQFPFISASIQTGYIKDTDLKKPQQNTIIDAKKTMIADNNRSWQFGFEDPEIITPGGLVRFAKYVTYFEDGKRYTYYKRALYIDNIGGIIVTPNNEIRVCLDVLRRCIPPTVLNDNEYRTLLNFIDNQTIVQYELNPRNLSNRNSRQVDRTVAIILGRERARAINTLLNR